MNSYIKPLDDNNVPTLIKLYQIGVDITFTCTSNQSAHGLTEYLCADVDCANCPFNESLTVADCVNALEKLQSVPPTSEQYLLDYACKHYPEHLI